MLWRQEVHIVNNVYSQDLQVIALTLDDLF